MKIKTTLIAAMLAVSGLTRAQVNKDVFEKAVNLVNCKLVELSLQKSRSKEEFQAFREKCPCQDNPDHKTIRLAIQDSETKTISLSDEINKLKERFNSELKSDTVIKLLTEDIFTNQTQYEKLFEFAGKRKEDSDFASLKNNLATQLSAQMGEGGFDRFTLQIVVFSIIISVVLSITITMVLMFVIYKIVLENKGYDLRSKIDEAKFKLSGNSTGGSGASLSEIKKLKDEIEALKREMNRLNQQIEKKLVRSSEIPLVIVQPRDEQPSRQDTKQPEVKTETFFLSTPNSDSSFNDSSVSPAYREGASIYKFTKVGNNRAKFRIDDREASVKLALTYPDKSIDPVCDAVNAFNPNAKRITTVEDGEAELQKDKWAVNQKAKIRYES